MATVGVKGLNECDRINVWVSVGIVLGGVQMSKHLNFKFILVENVLRGTVDLRNTCCPEYDEEDETWLETECVKTTH